MAPKRKAAQVCQVCLENEAKYKCPGCKRVQYCSVPCYKKHKTDSCLVPPPSVSDGTSGAATPARSSSAMDMDMDGLDEEEIGSEAPLSPTPRLRALSELAWPPEPDDSIYTDPLYKNDPKPLRRTTDPGLRRLLTSSASLPRVLSSIDALPTEAARRSALELILGVGSVSRPRAVPQVHPSLLPARGLGDENGGGHGNGWAGVGVSGGRGAGRTVSERELLRMGLRIGPDEAEEVRAFAELVSKAVEGPEYDAGGWVKESSSS